MQREGFLILYWTIFLTNLLSTVLPVILFKYNKSLENRRENAGAFPASQLQRYGAIWHEKNVYAGLQFSAAIALEI